MTRGMAVTEPSPQSQLLCFLLEGGFGGNCCQFQLGAGHVLAVRLWENVTLLFHYILHRPMSRAGFRPLPWSWHRTIKQWLLHGETDSLTLVPHGQAFWWQAGYLSTWPLTSTPAGTWCFPSTFSFAAWTIP